MACRGCSSSSNQRNRSSYGCRKALVNARWGTYTYDARANSGCSCNCMTNCNSCTSNTCGCANCAHTNCNCITNPCNCTANGCIQPRSSVNCGCNCVTNGCTGNTCGCTNSSCGCANTNCTTNSCIQPRSTAGCANRANNTCRSCTACTASPFYTGPCGPVYCPGSSGNCSCQGCCGSCSGCDCCHSCDCCTDTAIYGHFTQGGGLDVAQGGAIPFNGTSASNGILKSGGEFTITESGAYMISLHVTVPANTTLSTDFVTLIDDGIVAGGTIMIDKMQTDEPLHAQAQTVVSIAAGSVLRVVSSEAVSLSSSGEVAALTIVKVG